MKLKTITLITLIATVILGSCGAKDAAEALKNAVDSAQVNKPRGPVTPITWADMKKANSGKTVSIEGYLRVPSTMYTSGNNIQIDLYERPNQKDGFYLICSLPVGTGNNTATKMGVSYKIEDFKIKNDKGELLAGEGLHVRLTGELNMSSDTETVGSLFNVSKIESLDAATVDFDSMNIPEYKNNDAASLDNKLVYATGVLETNMFLNAYNNAYSLTLKGPKLADGEFLFAYVNIGSKADEMETPPENFTNKDIKIRDDKGNLFGINKKVKIYGVFSKSSTGGGNGGKISVEKIVVQ